MVVMGEVEEDEVPKAAPSLLSNFLISFWRCFSIMGIPFKVWN